MKTLEQLINEAEMGTNETHKGGVIPKDAKKAYKNSKDNEANVSDHPHGRWVTYHFGPAEVVKRQRKWRRPDYTKKNRWRKGENKSFNSEYASPITFVRRDSKGKEHGYKRIYGMVGRNKDYDGDNKKTNLTDLMLKQEWIHWWVPAKGEERHPEWKHNRNRARGVSERKFKEEDKNDFVNSVNFANFYQMIPGLVNKKGAEGEKQKENALGIYQFLRYNARARAFRAKHPDAKTDEYFDPKKTKRRDMLGDKWDAEAAAKVGVLSYTDADGESLIPLLRKKFNLTPKQCKDLKKAVDRFNEDARRKFADNHRYVGKRRGVGREVTEPLFKDVDKNGKRKSIQRKDANNNFLSGKIKPVERELEPEVVIGSKETKKQREKYDRMKSAQAKMHANDAAREKDNKEKKEIITAKKRAKAVVPYKEKSKAVVPYKGKSKSISSRQPIEPEVLPPQKALPNGHPIGKHYPTIDVTPERNSVDSGKKAIEAKKKAIENAKKAIKKSAKAVEASQKAIEKSKKSKKSSSSTTLIGKTKRRSIGSKKKSDSDKINSNKKSSKRKTSKEKNKGLLDIINGKK